MKILVIGSGAREHALVWKIAQSKKAAKIYCAPGNGGIASLAECVAIKPDDIAGLLEFAARHLVDLTVVGPEAPLVEGIADAFEDAGLNVFGPRRLAAQLEGSKDFTRTASEAFGLPGPRSMRCTSVEQVVASGETLGYPLVLKADGLAAGKGVEICESVAAAKITAERMIKDRVFGSAGDIVVAQEFLEGEEASILVLTNGTDVVPLASSQDHKRIFDGDRGPNTGGMGAYSPAPVVTPGLLDRVMTTVIRPTIAGLKKQGIVYRGVLYAGIMVTKKGPKLLEFNVRFGDPETQTVLARLKSDLVEAMLWTMGESRELPRLEWDRRPSVCVVMASGGYPGNYEIGKTIEGLDHAAGLKDVVVFHAGTKQVDGRIVTSGGRVLGVTALGKDLKEAQARAYEAVGKIAFEGAHYRKDIGWRALKAVDGR